MKDSSAKVSLKRCSYLIGLLGFFLTFSSCQFQDPEAVVVTASSPQGGNKNLLAITASNGLVNSTNQTSYSMAGTCSEQSSTIKLTIGPLIRTTSCNNGTFGFSIDLTGANDGTFTFNFAETVSTEAIYTTTYTTTKDITVPVMTPMADDAVEVSSKTISWSCNEVCSFRYALSSSEFVVPVGSYSFVNVITVNTGFQRYYLHVQAMDEAGNESAVETSYFLINDSLPAPLSATPLNLNMGNISSAKTNLGNEQLNEPPDEILTYASNQQIYFTGDQSLDGTQFIKLNTNGNDVSFKMVSTDKPDCLSVDFSVIPENHMNATIFIDVEEGRSVRICSVKKDQNNIWGLLPSQIVEHQIFRDFSENFIASYVQTVCQEGWESVIPEEFRMDPPPIKKHCRKK